MILMKIEIECSLGDKPLRFWMFYFLEKSKVGLSEDSYYYLLLQFLTVRMCVNKIIKLKTAEYSL